MSYKTYVIDNIFKEYWEELGIFKTLIKEDFHDEVVHIVKYTTTKAKSWIIENKTDSYDNFSIKQ